MIKKRQTKNNNIVTKLYSPYKIDRKSYILIEKTENTDSDGNFLRLDFIDEKTFSHMKMLQLMESRKEARYKKIEEDELKIRQKELDSMKRNEI